MADPDGIDEALEHHLRLALQAASLLAQRAAEGRAQRSRDLAHRLDIDTRAQTARATSERLALRAQASLFERDSWWTEATPVEMAHAWRSVEEWRGEPEGDAHRERFVEQLRSFTGIELPADTSEEAMREALNAYDDAARDRGSGGTDEEEEAAALVRAHLAEQALDRPEPEPGSRAGSIAHADAEAAAQHANLGRGIAPSAPVARAAARAAERSALPDRRRTLTGQLRHGRGR